MLLLNPDLSPGHGPEFAVLSLCGRILPILPQVPMERKLSGRATSEPAGGGKKIKMWDKNRACVRFTYGIKNRYEETPARKKVFSEKDSKND
jgi:hypothetical protein